MKKVSFILCSLLCAMSVSAQLSTGKVNSTIIPRTGNRPQAGDMGFYIGASVSQVLDLINFNNSHADKATGYGEWYWALPVLNLKYYATDNWETRIGFEFSCYSETNKTSMGGDTYKTATNCNFTRLLPGAAYHFNTNNILDVYLGAQIPIGWNINSEKTSGPDMTKKTTENAFVIGAGIFGGLQVFIADLPFAIGVELGYSGKATFGGAPNTKYTTNGDTGNTEEGNMNTKATRASGTWGADAAITFSYYFRK